MQQFLTIKMPQLGSIFAARWLVETQVRDSGE
jgi:hypothetical protein